LACYHWFVSTTSGRAPRLRETDYHNIEDAKPAIMVNLNDLVDWAMILAVAFYLVAEP
jgi:hypothetical protein